MFFTVLIFSIIFYFMVKYRRRSQDEISRRKRTRSLVAGAGLDDHSLADLRGHVRLVRRALYVRNCRPPAASTEIFVIGKQWMWHLQHPEGPREINELHVPVGVPVKLTMTSQDVIHDFYIPAFRVKKDVLPGRYTSHLVRGHRNRHLSPVLRPVLRHQPLGDDRLGLRDVAHATTPPGSRAARRANPWPSRASASSITTTATTAMCRTAAGRGPSLVGIFGKPEKLASGEMRVVDEDSDPPGDPDQPNSVHVAGYAPIMPTFKGQIDRGADIAADCLRQVARLARKGERKMSTATVDLHEAPAESRVNYLNASYGIKSWLLTLDHKRIGLALSRHRSRLMFLVGGMAAVLMRLNLIEPQGALVEPETYNKLFSIHGIIMVFFFLVPSIPATLGNFLIPLMIGARDVAFPKLNLMSWYIFITGCCFALVRRRCPAAWTPAGRSIRPIAAPIRTRTWLPPRSAFSSPGSPPSSPA